MTPVRKIELLLLCLCAAVVAGIYVAKYNRATRHYHHLTFASRNSCHEQVISEYHRLPRSLQEKPAVRDMYEKAAKEVKDKVYFDRFPSLEKADVIALVLFALFFCGFILVTRRKSPKKCSVETEAVIADTPSESQLRFIRRINNGIVPSGLTKETAASFIRNRLSRISEYTRRQRIEISPIDVMTGSQLRKERARLDRERKRAQEKILRQQKEERRRQEREESRAKREELRQYEKRLAEEAKLIKAREDSSAGLVRRAKSEKARTIQDFQGLVNDILADNKIEPQEVRRLKAWLLSNQQSQNDFAAMLKLIDDSLVDGVIDEEETQALYEGIMDCLVTLRERPGI